MILPYLAIALLVLVTGYAAFVAFRRPAKDARSTLFLPQGVGRGPRIAIGLGSLAIVVGLAAWLGVGSRNATRPSSRFLIPEGYTGWVRVEFEIPGEAPLPIENGQYVLRIPANGILRTSSPETYGWAKDSYVTYSDTGSKTLADSGPTQTIWGKINGESTTASGKRQYQEFFVGTEQQFRDQRVKE